MLMKIRSSEKLLKFYQNWLTWAENGAPEMRQFNPKTGLCYNLVRFYGEYVSEQLRQELCQQFRDAGVSPNYPFGGVGVYMEEEFYATHHLNKQRLHWVRERIKDMGAFL